MTVLYPCLAKAVAQLKANVVLPTPPLLFANNNFLVLVNFIAPSYQFLTIFTNRSSHPKHVSLPLNLPNALMQSGSSLANFSSTSTVSSINPPTAPSESSTPPVQSFLSSRKSMSTNNPAVCSLTGKSDTIFAKRVHPSDREF